MSLSISIGLASALLVVTEYFVVTRTGKYFLWLIFCCSFIWGRCIFVLFMDFTQLTSWSASFFQSPSEVLPKSVWRGRACLALLCSSSLQVYVPSRLTQVCRSFLCLSRSNPGHISCSSLWKYSDCFLEYLLIKLQFGAPQDGYQTCKRYRCRRLRHSNGNLPWLQSAQPPWSSGDLSSMGCSQKQEMVEGGAPLSLCSTL